MRRAVLLGLGGLALAASVLLWQAGSAGRGSGPVSPESTEAAARSDTAPGTLTALRPEPEVQAESPTAPGLAAVEVPAQPRVAAAATDASLGCVLYGRLTAAGGGGFPFDAPTVRVTDGSGTELRVTANREGLFSLSGLAPGTWTLTSWATGFRNAEERLEITAPLQRHDLVLVPAVAVRIRVTTPEGEDLATLARRRAREGERPLPLPTVLASPEGIGPLQAEHVDGWNAYALFETSGSQFEAAGPGILGVLVLRAEPPLQVHLVLGDRVLATQALPEPREELGFVLAPETLLGAQAHLRLRVVAGDTGKPLEGELMVNSNASYALRGGEWSTELLPGRVVLRPWVRGYQMPRIEVDLAPGEERDLGTIELEPELAIEGHLRDAEGRPVKGRIALGTRGDDGRVHYEQDFAYASDASGFFRIGGLGPGRFLLRSATDEPPDIPASGETPQGWFLAPVPVSTLGGSVSGLELRLEPAALLLLPSEPGLPNDLRVQVRGADDVLYFFTGLWPGTVPRCFLPLGTYEVILCDPDWKERARHSVELLPGRNELRLGL